MDNNFKSIMRTKLAAVLRASSIFGGLDDEAFHSLEAELELVSLTSSAVLFRQGDQGDSLYIVISGRLIVSVSLNGGAHKIIGTPGAGEIVGEMALLNDNPRSATVAAARDTQLAKLSSDGLARLSAKHPRAIFPLSRVKYLSACMKKLPGWKKQRRFPLASPSCH